MKNKSLRFRLQFAVNGICLAFSTEKSLRFQAAVAIIVVSVLGIVQPPLVWWAIIVLMIALVLFAELVNTALEVMCDFIQPDYSEQIKQIKDIAAGAVLILSLCSLIIAALFLMASLI